MFDDSVRDDLLVYGMAVTKQGPLSFYSIATLSDASVGQCRANHLEEFVDLGFGQGRYPGAAIRQKFEQSLGRQQLDSFAQWRAGNTETLAEAGFVYS